MTAREARSRRPDPTVDADCWLRLPEVVLTKQFRTIDDVAPIIDWVQLLNAHGWLGERWTASRHLETSGLPTITVRHRRRPAFDLRIGDYLVFSEGHLARVDDVSFRRKHQPLAGTANPVIAPVAHINPASPPTYTAERCG